MKRLLTTVLAAGCLIPAPALAAEFSGQLRLDGRPVQGAVRLELIAAAPMSAEMAQKDLAFAPGTLTVARGATVSFPNQDNVFHSVYSRSEGNAFDLGFYPKGKSKSVVMKQSGLVEVRCRVHQQMKATITVVDTAGAAPTDPEGRFAMRDLAPGHYRLVASLPNGMAAQRLITLGASGHQKLQLDLAPPCRPALLSHR